MACAGADCHLRPSVPGLVQAEQGGAGEEIEWRNLGANEQLPFLNWTDHMVCLLRLGESLGHLGPNARVMLADPCSFRCHFLDMRLFAGCD
jgi:hypothetical protein